MLKVLFLILAVMSSLVSAQTQKEPQENKLSEAYKLFEFKKISNSELDKQFGIFQKKLKFDRSLEGFVFNYGNDAAVASIERRIKKSHWLKDYNGLRITFIRAGFRKQPKTEFWIVPEGAKPPEP